MKLNRKTLLAVLGIGTLAFIGVLHALWFAPKAERFLTVERELAKSKKAGENVRLLEDQRELLKYQKETEELATHFDDVVTTLGLKREDVWYLPSIEHVEFTAPEGIDPEVAQELQIENYERKLKEVTNAQLDLVFEELRQLQRFDPDHPRTLAGDTDLPFMKDWNLPTELPEQARGALLHDILREAKSTLDFIEIIGEDQTTLRNEQRQIYYNTISKIGVDNRIYQNNQPRSLTWYGEFIPLAHKLLIGMLVEEELKNVSNSSFQSYDRAELYEMLDIHLPTSPLYQGDKTLNVNDLYFMYISLSFLNDVLAKAVEEDIPEITQIYFGDISYFVSAGGEDFPWFSGKPPSQRPVPQVSPYVIEQGKEAAQKRKILKQGEKDLGYAVPLYLQFNATNLVGWNFIYSVLRDHPLAELDEIEVLAPPPGSSDPNLLSWQVKFIQVPSLFAVEDPPYEVVAAAPGEAPPVDASIWGNIGAARAKARAERGKKK